MDCLANGTGEAGYSLGDYMMRLLFFLLRVVSIGFLIQAVIVMKGIKAKRLTIDPIRLELLNELRKTGTAMRKDFEKTTQTWEGERPDFGQAISLAQGGPTLLIEPQGGKGAQKWRWLDEGTSVRYATMTPDFQAKTKPRYLGSGRGRGGLMYVNRNRPRPGIKARGWTELIAKKWKRPFQRRMEEALIRGAKKTGHYIRR